MSTDNQTAYIYVIGPENGPYKIGWSAEPRSRLSNLQVGQAVTLSLLHEEAVDAVKGPVIEKLIHRQIAHKRIRGEWFDVSLPEAVAEIRYAMIRWDSEDHLVLRYKRKLL